MLPHIQKLIQLSWVSYGIKLQPIQLLSYISYSNMQPPPASISSQYQSSPYSLFSQSIFTVPLTEKPPNNQSSPCLPHSV